jgi:hypothetical protein
MIASLLCSIYIIYLYRKLNITEEPTASKGANEITALESEIATLNATIDKLEKMLSSVPTPVTAP